MTQIMFTLRPEEDWPPFTTECLTCSAQGSGYRVETPPLFIKDLSVGDVILIDQNKGNEVVSWTHLSRSNRTTVWILASLGYSIEQVLECLKELSCNVVRLEQYGCFSIDVPGEISIEGVDACLSTIDEERAAVVFPSFRH